MSGQLTRDQRCQIGALMSIGAKQKDVAAVVGVHPSTISRELRRNKSRRRLWHCGKEAHEQTSARRHRPAPRITALVRGEVIRLLQEQDWTPQAISERLRQERNVRVSHEWICRMLLADQAHGGELHKLLPCAGKRRKRRGVPETRGRIPDRAPIGQRPTAANERSEIGHWEGDAIIGARHQGAIVTMAERKSRFFVAACAKRKTKALVGDALRTCMAEHKDRCSTITFDNGREFAGHAAVGGALQATTYFADPYSSWQRATNEWLNRRLRRHFPKGRSLTNATKRELDAALHKINRHPMKVLGWKTPFEAYYGVTQQLTRNCV